MADKNTSCANQRTEFSLRNPEWMQTMEVALLDLGSSSGFHRYLNPQADTQACTEIKNKSLKRSVAVHIEYFFSMWSDSMMFMQPKRERSHVQRQGQRPGCR